MMSAETRQITRADIMDPQAYANERRERRSAMLPVKKLRRIEVGPHATFYFENYDTMWLQIHEMLHIEKGGEEQIEDELAAYNPLIPQGKDLSATLMFEIDDPIRRANVLGRLAYVEEKAFFQIGDQKVFASPEHDVERVTEDGKTSSVHFLHFHFTPEQIGAFANPSTQILLGIEHENYAHLAILSDATKTELSKDFA